MVWVPRYGVACNSTANRAVQSIEIKNGSFSKKEWSRALDKQRINACFMRRFKVCHMLCWRRAKCTSQLSSAAYVVPRQVGTRKSAWCCYLLHGAIPTSRNRKRGVASAVLPTRKLPDDLGNCIYRH
jgi:hypothetical protein